ncbi:MAG: hypothetical protein IJP88_12625 [Synergistaceae bacterium]|nr:hypothetical protein [Synergistaceae bacterium]MBR0098017.1 hypothetical protein [Synergistaceae bacterium]
MADNHENYSSLKGGNSNGHYHLNKSQWTKLRELLGFPAEPEKSYPPSITYGQVITIEAGVAMTPYEVWGENVRI